MPNVKHLPAFQMIDLEVRQQTAVVNLNRPQKCNAMNDTLWGNLFDVYQWIEEQSDIKVCILKGHGKYFTTGADIKYLEQIREDTTKIPKQEQANHLKQKILAMQKPFTAIENCSKPTIAAIHGMCLGAGIDLISACDIRLATFRTVFCIMETQLGIAADMGTLQRLHNVVGAGRLKELVYTSRFFSGRQAKKYGLLEETYLTQKGLNRAANNLANKIASMPQEAVLWSKKSLNYSRDHTIQEGLEHIATLNSHYLPTMAKIAKS